MEELAKYRRGFERRLAIRRGSKTGRRSVDRRKPQFLDRDLLMIMAIFVTAWAFILWGIVSSVGGQ